MTTNQALITLVLILAMFSGFILWKCIAMNSVLNECETGNRALQSFKQSTMNTVEIVEERLLVADSITGKNERVNLIHKACINDLRDLKNGGK